MSLSADVAVPLVIVAFIAVAAVLIWASIVAARKRREAFALLAGRLGLSYAPDDPFDTVDLPFGLFSQGDRQEVADVLWGDAAGMRVRLFDFTYVVVHHNSDGPDTTSSHRFSCAMCELDAHCPPLSIGPEGALSWIAGKLGFRDIEFESEEFNRAFKVKSDDKRFANALIDARMMSWLLEEGHVAAYEVSGPLALCYVDRLKPHEYENLLEVLRRFHARVPNVVASLYPRGDEART